MTKKITYSIIAITCALFAWTYYQIIANAIKGWNLINTGSLKQIYNFFNYEKWYEIGRMCPPKNLLLNKETLILIILLLVALLESRPAQMNVPYKLIKELINAWAILSVITLMTGFIFLASLPFDHVETHNHVSQLANQEIQKHYTTTKTIKSDHYSKIDDATFVINSKTYKIANKNNITNNYAKTPPKRSIKITYQVVDKKLPKEVAAYYTIPINRTQKNNDTIKVEINQ